METTVTGLFTDAEVAGKARRELERQGFGPEAITMLTKETEDLHAALGEETSDAARGLAVGAAVGGVGAAIAAVVLTLPPLQVFDAHWLVVGLSGGAVGAVIAGAIGFMVGSATGHQVQDEYEHSIARGGQVIAINTDRERATKAHAILEKLGGKALSTAVHRKQHTGQPA